MIEYMWMMLGTFMFLLRIYMVEFKLKDVFAQEKFFLSRYLNLLFWVLMILQFESNLLNFTIIMSFPVIIYSLFVNDPLFFRLFYQKRNSLISKKQEIWLILERITLHLPLFIYVIYTALMISPPFFQDLTLIDAFGGFILNIGILLAIDSRRPWNKTADFPSWQFYAILLGNLSTGIFLYFFFI